MFSANDMPLSVVLRRNSGAGDAVVSQITLAIFLRKLHGKGDVVVSQITLAIFHRKLHGKAGIGDETSPPSPPCPVK